MSPMPWKLRSSPPECAKADTERTRRVERMAAEDTNRFMRISKGLKQFRAKVVAAQALKGHGASMESSLLRKDHVNVNSMLICRRRAGCSVGITAWIGLSNVDNSIAGTSALPLNSVPPIARTF